eukprot:g2922.t1
MDIDLCTEFLKRFVITVLARSEVYPKEVFRYLPYNANLLAAGTFQCIDPALKIYFDEITTGIREKLEDEFESTKERTKRFGFAVPIFNSIAADGKKITEVNHVLELCLLSSLNDHSYMKGFTTVRKFSSAKEMYAELLEQLVNSDLMESSLAKVEKISVPGQKQFTIEVYLNSEESKAEEQWPTNETTSRHPPKATKGLFSHFFSRAERESGGTGSASTWPKLIVMFEGSTSDLLLCRYSCLFGEVISS